MLERFLEAIFSIVLLNCSTQLGPQRALNSFLFNRFSLFQHTVGPPWRLKKFDSGCQNVLGEASFTQQSHRVGRFPLLASLFVVCCFLLRRVLCPLSRTENSAFQNYKNIDFLIFKRATFSTSFFRPRPFPGPGRTSSKLHVFLYFLVSFSELGKPSGRASP